MPQMDRLMRRIVLLVDTAAAVFLAVITALTFLAVLLRYVFSLPFPGAFDVSRLLLGIAIFWGIAVAAYRRQHIQVDIVWQVLPPRVRQVLDIFSDLVFALFAGVLSWMLFVQVGKVRLSQQTTFELAIPVWPFHAVALLGMALCLVILLARLLRVALVLTSGRTDAS